MFARRLGVDPKGWWARSVRLRVDSAVAVS